MDKLTPDKRKKNMQAVKSNGSQIELILGKELWKKGLRYKKNDKAVFGKPDFTFKKYKVAVFCDSEFWHGKDWESKKYEHKSNIKFWHRKIEGNIERDKVVNRELFTSGWYVIRFWGKEIKKDPKGCAEQVEKAIYDIKNEK